MNLRLAIIIASISGGLMILTIIASLFINRDTTTNTNTQVPTQAAAIPSPTYQAPAENALPSPGKSLITGTICPQTPGGTIPPSMIIAESIPSRQKTTKFFPGSIATKATTYALELDPGTYEVYSQDNTQEKLALYSENVTCGGLDYCNTHTLIQVNAPTNERVPNINLCDYSWKNQPVTKTFVTPTFIPQISISPTISARTSLTPTTTPLPTVRSVF